MDKPIHPDIIKKVLLTLIKKDYPSVLDVRVHHTFYDINYVSSNINKYDVYVKVDYHDTIRDNSYNFLKYVDNLCKYIVPRPDAVELKGLY
jgi:hypothetical protein